MKGEFIHPRTRTMLEAALLHARAQFETSCARHAPAACMIYEGQAWNGGTHLTVIVDRAPCTEHAVPPRWIRVEMWVYDIRGESPLYMGKDSHPQNLALLKEPGDRADGSASQRPFIRH